MILVAYLEVFIMSTRSLFPLFGIISTCLELTSGWRQCRNQPGDPGFPTQEQWDQLNSQVGGRLISVVPSAKFCHDLPSGSCTEAEWISTTFRSTIPGAMDNYNWEQDYSSNPPSICLQNGTTCGQGNVPIFAVNASSISDIQAGVNFARTHNLKLSVKASGHDFLGRSTAKGSLMLWTHYFRNITFDDDFVVGNNSVGNTMTVGSGVPLNMMYQSAKAQGKMVCAGFASTVVASGGYIQGGGHSAFSPALGLAVDNVVQFEIVTADGKLLTANEDEHSDLFWALRGGGAGSWGVIISTTFKTFPAFNATALTTIYLSTSLNSTLSVVEAHTNHSSDWDALRAGQYFYIYPTYPGVPGTVISISTLFPNATNETASAAMAPLLTDLNALNVTQVYLNSETALASDIVTTADDQLGANNLLGSRLIPTSVYENNVQGVVDTYKALIESGVQGILSHFVAGGKVAENKDLDVSVNSKWRNAKSHLIAATTYPDNTTVSEVEDIKDTMTNKWVPLLAKLTGESDSGAYSNEADAREPNFQVTFFGDNYKKLLATKNKYDPNGLFIVTAGVGSEGWNAEGLCRAN
ncbi:FAD-binding domain-containing protein [Schizopora paradoxa]|uniref:FAD-binding domain-containing protein n=1 Tax=Schizopora paradoxa TaxID=27342 RepID=A0A0H2RPZ3_9AGAM|nr:FAD-binding domain-containing protein [Schizopora paradoxa]